jgi:hypothetical protein
VYHIAQLAEVAHLLHLSALSDFSKKESDQEVIDAWRRSRIQAQGKDPDSVEGERAEDGEELGE